jgi:hypothetical protein
MAVRPCEYGAPTAPAGKMYVVNGSTVIGVAASVNVWLAVTEVASVTVTVNVEVTAEAVEDAQIQVVAVGTAPVAY